MATLRLVPASGSHIDIEGEQAVVGRDPTCDVVVNDVSVSRKHARLERWGSNWAVIDERSANGTFLDGKRVAETMLGAGQELRFGAVAYRVELQEEETGATVMMSIPDMNAGAGHRPAVPSRPAVRPPAPPAPPPPPPRDLPPAPAVAHVPEPAKKGKGSLFWTAIGCGGLLLALIGVGAIVGIPFYGSRGTVDIAEPGNKTPPAPVPTADSGGLTVETITMKKVPQGQTVAVKIDVRVTGFDLRPEGNVFRVDLAEDLETFGPDGNRIDELSRVGLETFNQTTPSTADATATFNTSLTFSKPEPGKYRAVLTIRDLVGIKSKKHEVPFDLP